MPNPGEVYERVYCGRVTFRITISGFMGPYIVSQKIGDTMTLWTRPSDFARYVAEGKLRLMAALSAGGSDGKR